MAISLKSLKKGLEIKPPTIILYGVAGIGKSTWASEAPNPVFIQTEEGLNTLDVAKFPLAKNINDVYESIGALVNEQHDFQTLIIDSIDWFEKLVHIDVRKTHGEDVFTDYGRGYKFATPYFEKLVDGLNVLRNEKGMAIILVGHAKVTPFNAPDTAAYDRYSIDLHKEAATTIEEWAECIFFANYKVYVQKEDGGFGKEVKKAAGKGDRIVYTQERPPYKAKNRYLLPHELPMDFGSFSRAMAEGISKLKNKNKGE